jgi:hypothetical protein
MTILVAAVETKRMTQQLTLTQYKLKITLMNILFLRKKIAAPLLFVCVCAAGVIYIHYICIMHYA